MKISIDKSITNLKGYFGNRFPLALCLVDLYIMAADKDTTIRIRGIDIEVRKGQVATSVRKLSERWSMSKNTVMKVLNELKSETQIETQISNVICLITPLDNVVKEKIKTKSETQIGTQIGTQNCVPISQTSVNRFIPPTEEEVCAYITEKHYPVNAKSFVNFYTSKGWMVGKNKMKDWKAAVRTWVEKRKREGAILTDNTEDKYKNTALW